MNAETHSTPSTERESFPKNFLQQTETDYVTERKRITTGNKMRKRVGNNLTPMSPNPTVQNAICVTV